ncbi:site-specific DNA-methyltransferase [Paenibacillus tianjinensis]|uniref:Site-specific DNA-methyltransferase n=1 Tax=Paenibacillus tianjinensis TaxID=2810347 RepID=A0ABX7L4I9_9BACL|nr:site-specific DNA-methyltransferase [Paenibacillus tianjinensis]QSF42840.1 site-specific DNA-methyltransferase [Paenibacillus tianjinensis]
MNKLTMRSADLTQDNIDKIAELFPSVITESRDNQGGIRRAIDFELLKQELSHFLVEGEKERYQVTWPGKKEAIVNANSSIEKTLRPVVQDSIDWENTKNLYIEGDNLEVLKLLQESYLNKIKMIYIDPPYNTGKDFIYNDNFREPTEEYLEQSGQVDEEGNRLFQNTESNGRFHSDWMTMIYTRLRIARNLLSDDGVIFVSIDEHEENNLTALMNSVFYEENRISKITWEKGRKNDSTFYSESVEYVLVYAKDKSLASKFGKWRAKKPGYDEVMNKFNSLRKKNNDNSQIEEGMKEFYKNLPDNHPAKEISHFFRVDNRGLYFGGDISSASTSIPDYEVIHPVTQKSVKKPSRGWGCIETEMKRRIAEDRVHFGIDETTIPLRKIYLHEAQDYVLTPVIYKDGRAASMTLKELLGGNYFENPKDVTVLKSFIEYVGCENGILLDFFSGSASFAQAVIQLNAEDKGNRKFIMVQLPQKTKEDSEAFKAGYKNICEIGKERIRRASKKIKEETGADIDYGFRVYRVDSSNMKDVYYTPDKLGQLNLDDVASNIKEDRSGEDLLIQVMLELGLELSLPMESKEIEGKTVHYIAGNSLIACFDSEITETVIKKVAEDQPLRVVFRDSSFRDDSARINVEELFKLLSPSTDIQVL